MDSLVIALVALFVMVAFVFIGVHVYAYGAIWIDSVRLRRSLAKKGRTLELREAVEKIRQKEGLIIVDAPTLGWNVSRVWWSPVVDFVPRPDSWQRDDLCPREDFLNYQKFIDPSKGVAKLVAGFVISQRVKTFLRRHFGITGCGFVWSGGVLMEEHMKARRAETVIPERKSKPMFPEDRGILFVFSPILGAFFVVCVYFVLTWEPSSTADKVGRWLVLEILATFLMLCCIGFIASIIGPDRMRPLITRVGVMAALTGLALIVGFGLVLLYYGFKS